MTDNNNNQVTSPGHPHAHARPQPHHFQPPPLHQNPHQQPHQIPNLHIQQQQQQQLPFQPQPQQQRHQPASSPGNAREAKEAREQAAAAKAALEEQEKYEITPVSMMTGNAAVLGAIQGNCPEKQKLKRNPVLAQFAEEAKKQGHKLEDQSFYMGMLSEKDVASYLTNPGEFAVHANDRTAGAVKLQLTVKGIKGLVYHFDIVFDALGKGWSLKNAAGSKFHKTICLLINQYHVLPLPIPEQIVLVDTFRRPEWFLRHESVKFDRADLLGKGNFCEVFRGTILKNNTFKIVAVKVCHANWRYDDTVSIATNVKEQQARDSLIKEGAVMKLVDHKNVITFHGICCDRPPIMIALELCPGDSLLRHLIKWKDQITFGERVKFMVESAAGMAHLQGHALIHRDLAARNCLISVQGCVKIADFGLSKLVGQLAGEQWNSQQIPLRWMAPETLKAAPDYSIKSDVWAFGVLAYEIWTSGDKPWPDWENKKIATYIRRGQMVEMPPSTPVPVKQLVQECWKLNPQERPDFNAIYLKISEIQKAVPAPPPLECTVARIPGVTFMPEEEPREQQQPEVVQRDKEASEDVAYEVATSAVSAPTIPNVELPPSIHGNVVDTPPQVPPTPQVQVHQFQQQQGAQVQGQVQVHHQHAKLRDKHGDVKYKEVTCEDNSIPKERDKEATREKPHRDAEVKTPEKERKPPSVKKEKKSNGAKGKKKKKRGATTTENEDYALKTCDDTTNVTVEKCSGGATLETENEVTQERTTEKCPTPKRNNKTPVSPKKSAPKKQKQSQQQDAAGGGTSRKRSKDKQPSAPKVTKKITQM